MSPPALGQAIRLASPSGDATEVKGAPAVPAQVYTVIGIVRDVPTALTLFDFGYSGLYLPTTPEQARTSFVVRVHGDPDAARRTMLDSLTKIDPAIGITTMRMMAGVQTAILAVVFWMSIILGSLALALTVSGLFSVLSYLVEQRRTEIGVRMALGATPRDMVTLVLSQLMRPIGVGVIAGGGLAAVAAMVLLATPVAAGIGTLVHAFDPLAYAVSLGIIVATCLVAAFFPARRAARIDPSAALRAD